MSDKYRKCVGMMILNSKNEILVGRRLDHPSGYWQMPQGGIDEKENPEEAVWREMMEEIGTNNLIFLKFHNNGLNTIYLKKHLINFPGVKHMWAKCKNGLSLNSREKKMILM